MRTRGFHRGVYAEGMRRLATLGWLALVLITVFSAMEPAFDLMQGNRYRGNLPEWYFRDMVDGYPFLPALPFLLPTVFMAKLFSFQNSRRDSDFYHSLPVTRSTLHWSLLAAVATWCGIVVFVSSAVVGPLSVLTNGPMNIGEAMLTVLGVFVSCLFVMSVVFLGYALSGNTLTALAASGILLFAPTVISIALAETMVYDIDVVHISDLAFEHYQLLYMHYLDWEAWIVTVLVTLLCLGLGLWVGAKRPSETAGQSSITPMLQHLLRLLLSFTVCLMPMTMIYDVGTRRAQMTTYTFLTIVKWYLIALAVYFLFELITTRKVKNLVKAIPWLGVLAVMNAVCVLGMHATVFTFKMIDQDNYDDISWVQVLEPVDYWSYEKTDTGGVEVDLRPHVDSVDPFEYFVEGYVNTACPEVKLSSDAARYIAQEAVERTLRYRDEANDSWELVEQVAKNAEHGSGYIYQVKVRVNCFISRTRLVYMYEHEMQSLLKQIDKHATVPQLDTILAWNYKG